MKLLTPHPKKFTTETYHKMSELGLFKEGDRLELIKGEIIEMSPVGWKHASCVKRLNHLSPMAHCNLHHYNVKYNITLLAGFDKGILRSILLNALNPKIDNGLQDGQILANSWRRA